MVVRIVGAAQAKNSDGSLRCATVLSPDLTLERDALGSTEGSTTRAHLTSPTRLTCAAKRRGASPHESKWAVLGSNQ
jgi:hypothetical protein